VAKELKKKDLLHNQTFTDTTYIPVFSDVAPYSSDVAPYSLFVDDTAANDLLYLGSGPAISICSHLLQKTGGKGNQLSDDMVRRVGIGHLPHIDSIQLTDSAIRAFRAFLYSHGSLVQKLVQKRRPT